MFWKTDFTCRQAVRRHPWRHRRGFSIIELLIVIAILISLGAIAALAYKTYMTSVKIDLSVNQMLRIEDRIKTDFELTLNGVDTGLRVPGADQPITSESTCRDFVTAIKERLKPYKNPFDRSPAVTYSSYSNLHHKERQGAGHLLQAVPPWHRERRRLPLREAAIRITKFKVPCGSKCVHPNCIYSGASCRGHDPKVWYAGMQEEIFVGKLLKAT